MTKPIIGAIAAALVCLTGSPGVAHTLTSGAQAEPSIIMETAEGFAICSCASACSAQTAKRPAPVQIGANVLLDPAVMKVGRLNDKDARHAK